MMRAVRREEPQLFAYKYGRDHGDIRQVCSAATLLPNEEALIRLVSAILMEISEEWETGRAYLDMTTENENNDSSQFYRKDVA